MSERAGLWSPLSVPWVYEGFHHLIGARRWLRRFARNVVKAGANERVLDIGCGPGALLRYLTPGTVYVGLDRNASYIARARQVYGNRGTFICDDVSHFSDHALSKVDVAVAIGLLHHLDDNLALDVMRAAERTLRPGGRLITVDPCFHSSQSRIQRFVVGIDRGMYVRNFPDYQDLCARVFRKVDASWEKWHFPFPTSMCIVQSQL